MFRVEGPPGTWSEITSDSSKSCSSGTGRTPTTQDVAEVHAAIRAEIAAKLGKETADGMRILYGGSVKPSNAAELMALADVDGALVGGASLKVADFWSIIETCL